ncbi:unnamed protein product [Thlaspi arvense]|uniref:Late embryogenesis abundant protein LEA-2 subgroup domain-containing protein n=1 Tax=Thlaspi arvense TaxID=13288 RepID=A0AAU9SI70_THLAR|nr:unnamed protein product [Thlaspi arvense]
MMAPGKGKRKEDYRSWIWLSLVLVIYFLVVGYIIRFAEQVKDRMKQEEARVPNIEVASMDFRVQNLRQTRLSANWDILVRIPERLPDKFICLQGDLQASLFYKGVTLVTSSRQRYNNLKAHSPQQLRVSASISEEDIGGLIGKNINKDIKEKREVKFGLQLFLTDCRENSTGVLRYVCDETTLRFEPGSGMKATAFGNNTTCVSF